MRAAAVWTVILCVALSEPALADDDDDWGGGWDELDEPRARDPEEIEPMVLGAQTLPAGRFGLRLSAGYPFVTAGVHAGLADRFDLIGEFMMPYTLPGKLFLVGGGGKVNIFGFGEKFRSAFKLRALGILYPGSDDELYKMAPGMLIWPSFVIGMKVKEGCFYGEVGLILYPYIEEGAERDYVFYSVPMHFGGELNITDLIHVFINVDFGFTIFGPIFTGIEGGVLFVL